MVDIGPRPLLFGQLVRIQVTVMEMEIQLSGLGRRRIDEIRSTKECRFEHDSKSHTWFEGRSWEIIQRTMIKFEAVKGNSNSAINGTKSLLI